MRGAFGKPFGVCARVCIGQILLSIRCKDAHGAVAEEALRRAKFKFPGRQKIVASRNWCASLARSADPSIYLCPSLMPRDVCFTHNTLRFQGLHPLPA